MTRAGSRFGRWPPAVDRREQIAPQSFISHLRQVFHVDVDIARLVILEGTALRLRCLALEIAQVADAVPTPTAVQPRARGIRVRNSRTTDKRSSSDTSRVLRRATATASCAGVNVGQGVGLLMHPSYHAGFTRGISHGICATKPRWRQTEIGSNWSDSTTGSHWSG